MNRTTLTIPLILLLAACSDSDDGQASERTSASTTVVSTTTVAPTTAAPTTAAPTTVAVTPAESVAFSTSGQQVTTIPFADPALSGAVIYSHAAGDAEGALTSVLATMGGTSVALVWFEGTVADCGGWRNEMPMYYSQAWDGNAPGFLDCSSTRRLLCCD